MNEVEKIKIIQDFIFNDEVQNILSKINDNVMDFNILEITGMGNQEIKHSNILGWLFDDSEHNLEYHILDNFLKKVIELNPNEELQSYLYLSNKKRDITIYREKDSIDLLIVDESNKIVITIENKVYANERKDGKDGGQLQKYEDTINEKYNKDYEKYFIFLTIDLEKPSEGNEYWLRANHQMITDAIKDILKTKEITTKTKIVLESYVDLLKRNGIVADKKLEELCNQIWANKDYRNALDILNENEPTNLEIISKIIVQRLNNIGINKIEFYAKKENDILFRIKNMDEELQYNLDFDNWGIRLALYIDADNEKYDIFHQELFPKKRKKNHRNQIKILKKYDNWNQYMSDVSNDNLENNIKEDLDIIFEEIKKMNNKISKIKL